MPQLNIQDLDRLALDHIFKKLDLENQINLGLTSKYLWKVFMGNFRILLTNLYKGRYVHFWFKEVNCKICEKGYYHFKYLVYYQKLGYTKEQINELYFDNKWEKNGSIDLNDDEAIREFFLNILKF